jgi:hypothetical protein
MTQRIHEYNGKRYTLRELSTACGVTFHTLYGRFQAGDRGERLTRPVEWKGQSSEPAPNPNTDLQAMKVERLSRREQEQVERLRADQRRDERKQRIAQLRQQYLEALQRPLIDAGLLTAEEREAIYAGVTGQQRWRSLGDRSI